ncbi:MAG: helix-turn-helix domain-containing protein, partial [Christensenellales bacterium]
MKAKKYDEESYNKPFPKRLRALLDNEDGISPLDKIVTQTELAQAFSDNGMPVTRQTISLYANGETKPDYEKFKFIADFFQVSYDFLLGETEAIRRQNIDIYEQTGLTDDTIDALKLMKLSADGVVSELSIEDEIRAKYALLVLNRIFAWNNIVSITGPICDYFRSKIKFDVRMEAISNSDEMELQNEHYDL